MPPHPHPPISGAGAEPCRRAGRARCALVFVGILGLAGCATAPVNAPTPAPATPAAAPVAPPAPAAEGAVPNVDLTGALLFQIMAAEVALQRGDAGAAYATFIAVARQTRDPRLARRATEIAIGARALPQALEGARLWRTLDPRDDEALQALSALLVGNERFDEAAPLFAEQVARAPAAELARVQRTLARLPNRDATWQLLQKLAAPYLDDPQLGPDVRLTLAQAAQAAGRPADALAQARAALAQRPDSEPAAITTATLLAVPGGKEDPAGRAEAIALLARFLEAQPAARQARMTYARLLTADGRYADARAQFQRVAQENPRDLDALYAAGVLTLEAPALRPQARALFEQYLQVLAENPSATRDPDPVYLNLARIAEDERKFDEALRWLDRIDDGEQLFTAQLRKALVLGKMKRVDAARKVLAGVAADSAEERTQVLLIEGQMLREAGRHQESFDLLAGALAKAPEDSALLYDAAMAAEKLDRLDVMERHLRELMKRKPEDAHAFNALGYTLADRNLRLPEAYALIAQALKLAPADAYILDSMGWVYFRLGNLAKAREYLTRAWQARPHAEVGAHYGEVLWQLGERDEARRIWRSARELEPDNDTLRSTLQRLKARL
jgi:tetratricopeptide (TPR) repeat protein